MGGLLTAVATLVGASYAAGLFRRRRAAALARQQLDDRDLNPAGPGLAAGFTTFTVGEGAGTALVRRPACGLLWQHQAQPACPFADAETAVRALNATHYGQGTDWRLPSAEEAAILCFPHRADGVATPSPFARGAPFIWTADRTPDERGWVAYLNDGQLSPESVQFNAWVRAVCTDTPT